ncbi:MAG: hypothetical protein ABII89_03650 [Candidatus Omnitrophota bacterium]
MNILFYIEPMIEREKPFLKIAWWVFSYKLMKALKKDISADYNFCVIANEPTISKIPPENEPQKYNIIPVTQEELLSPFNLDYFTASMAWYNEIYTQSQIEQTASLMKRKLGNFVPQIIITFSPVPFLKRLFPESLIFFMEYGIFSRRPYPETFYLDPLGNFKNSFIMKYKEQIGNQTISKEQRQFIQRVKAKYIPFLASRDPFTNLAKEKLKGFKKSLLVPLESSRFYGFDGNCQFTSQFQYVLYVLSRIPRDIGVIFTAHPEWPILNREVVSYLTATYQNFIYDEIFEHYYSPSQYLIRHVDGVVTVSSSVGLQTLLFEKKLIVLGQSHLNVMSDAYSLDNIEDVLNSPGGDKTHIFYWLLNHYYILDKYIFSPVWLGGFLHKSLKKTKNGIGFDFFDPIHNDEKKYFDDLTTACQEDIPHINWTFTLDRTMDMLRQKEQEVQQKEQAIQQKEQVIQQKEQVIQQKEQVIQQLLSSPSWKITAPLRWLKHKIILIGIRTKQGATWGKDGS